MSGIAQNNPATLPVRMRPSRLVWLAVVVVIVAGAIAVAMFVVNDDGGSSPAAATAAPAVSRPADVRYDGGPEEGTRGPSSSTQSPTTRYDGGPEEGTRGPGR